MDDGEELADVVGAVQGAVMEHDAAGGEAHAPVFHGAGIAGAGSVDGPGSGGDGRVVGGTEGASRLGLLFGVPGHGLEDEEGAGVAAESLGGGVLVGEGLVFSAGPVFNLCLALVPVGVDAGGAAFPDDVVFLAFCHCGDWSGELQEQVDVDGAHTQGSGDDDVDGFAEEGADGAAHPGVDFEGVGG